MKMYTTVKEHYDLLIDEGNDPVYDPIPLQEYMDKWDGQKFIDSLKLTKGKYVLEVGVGTGRLARKVCGYCEKFVGIDISPKTIERAKYNLSEYKNTQLICADILNFESESRFDVIYSTLTFMHINDKLLAMNKVKKLLKSEGRFVLSISNDLSGYIDYGTRKIEIYPDTPNEITLYLYKVGLKLVDTFYTEFATVFIVENA